MLHARFADKSATLCRAWQAAAPSHAHSAAALDAAAGRLPPPVQRFVERLGGPGRLAATRAVTEWDSMQLRFGAGAPWRDVKAEQMNTTAPLARHVFMAATVWGCVPFEGRDAYMDGHGSMVLRVAGCLPVGDATGPEMDASALVTVLAEAVLLPSTFLLPGLRWGAVAPADRGADVAFPPAPPGGTRVGATLTADCGGASVGGDFVFDAAGDIVRFETRDRYATVAGGRYERIPWFASIHGYAVDAGRPAWRRAASMSASWSHAPGSVSASTPLEYFRGTVANVRCDSVSVPR